MSNAKQETIADIVADMREFADTDSQTIGRDVLRRHIQHFARRIEAAAKREVAELRKDNVSLRAALKPVLEVYISQDDNSVSVYDSQLDAAFALNAVREAKRIYNEGEERIASPRNCDMYATLDDARNAFFADYVSDETCSSATAFSIWLFDKAKGGAK